MTRIAILGGGPAGVGGAWRLRHLDRAEVVLIERGKAFGGNSGSFRFSDHPVDYGSHRLHPACDGDILNDIRGFLGDELLDRPRHGRIRLLGQWVHFPLKLGDLLWNLDKSFAVSSLRDMAGKPFASKNSGSPETFATVLQANLGKTICKHFYFPYARKIWGRAPEELSAIQAHRRVSAGTFTKLLRKVMGQLPGLRRPGTGRFFYPRQGFGQISEGYAQRAGELGAEMLLEHTVTALEQPSDSTSSWRVSVEHAGQTRTFDADYVWSTLPVTLLVKMLRPAAPAEVLEQCGRIEYRSMVLVYLELDVPAFTEFDAHYFPGKDVAITRLSEPKTYGHRSEPAGSTVLCAELPCTIGDGYWKMSDDELAELVAGDLDRSGLPLPCRPRNVMTRRLPQAYPIYTQGYREALEILDEYVGRVPRLLTYGRQGLFAHDNTHHALYMAYAAADCIEDGEFDQSRWADYRKVFETHVVED